MWRTIPDWDHYEVSDDGRVRKIVRGRVPERKLIPDGKGYLRVTLIQGPRRRIVFVHRLVMLAFVGPMPDGDAVDHINSVRDDNRLDNLRYLPRRTNSAQGGFRGLTAMEGERHGMAKITEADVRLIRLMRRQGAKLTKIEAALGGKIKIANISDIARYKTWTHIE